MKYFKEFCAKKIHDGIHGKTYFGHPFQEGTNEFNIDWNLLAKDLEFTINPKHITDRYNPVDTSISRDEYWELHKKAIEKLIKINTSLNEENFLDSQACVKIKMDMNQFNTGVSLKQLNGISKEYGSENVHVAGDGNDYSYSEYTSGHDSEIIITAEIGDPKLFLKQYNDWAVKKIESLELKKQAKKSNKKN